MFFHCRSYFLFIFTDIQLFPFKQHQYFIRHHIVDAKGTQKHLLGLALGGDNTANCRNCYQIPSKCQIIV